MTVSTLTRSIAHIVLPLVSILPLIIGIGICRMPFGTESGCLRLKFLRGPAFDVVIFCLGGDEDTRLHVLNIGRCRYLDICRAACGNGVGDEDQKREQADDGKRADAKTDQRPFPRPVLDNAEQADEKRDGRPHYDHIQELGKRRAAGGATIA